MEAYRDRRSGGARSPIPSRASDRGRDRDDRDRDDRDDSRSKRRRPRRERRRDGAAQRAKESARHRAEARVTEVDPDGDYGGQFAAFDLSPQILKALDDIYQRQGDWENLVGVLGKRESIATDGKDKAVLVTLYNRW